MASRTSSIEKFHSYVQDLLRNASFRSGKAGEMFSNAEDLLYSHLQKEEDILMPLLRYLHDRLEDDFEFDYATLDYAVQMMDEEYDNMLEEHRAILNAVSIIAETFSGDAEAESILDALKNHIGLEEEILYPAAIGALDLIEYEKAVAR